MTHVRRLLVESRRSRLKYQAIKLARIHNWKSDWIENVLYVCTEMDRSQEGERAAAAIRTRYIRMNCENLRTLGFYDSIAGSSTKVSCRSNRAQKEVENFCNQIRFKVIALFFCDLYFLLTQFLLLLTSYRASLAAAMITQRSSTSSLSIWQNREYRLRACPTCEWNVKSTQSLPWILNFNRQFSRSDENIMSSRVRGFLIATSVHTQDSNLLWFAKSKYFFSQVHSSARLVKQWSSRVFGPNEESAKMEIKKQFLFTANLFCVVLALFFLRSTINHMYDAAEAISGGTLEFRVEIMRRQREDCKNCII